MCHKLMLLTVFSCGHAVPDPPDGRKVDCLDYKCRRSRNHPEGCTGTTCVQGCFQYMTQPRIVTNRHMPYPCPRCPPPPPPGPSTAA